MEDITPAWLEWALKKYETIGKNTRIKDAKVTKLTTTAGGEGGGGMSEAELLRILLEYDDNGSLTGTEPKSLVAKVVFQIKMLHSTSLKNRILLKSLARIFGDKTEEEFWRTEAKFYREVIPLFDESFQHPKVYYTGINDISDRSEFSTVILNKPSKLKCIILVEDLSAWKSETILSPLLAGGLRRDYLENMLKNIAIFHATFWGEKAESLPKSFKEPANIEASHCRAATHSRYMAWKRKNCVSSTSSLQKMLKKGVSQWSKHKWMSLHKDVKKPFWITISPLPDGSIPILEDPAVLEMLKVFGERYPKFNSEVARQYQEKPMQTLLHGDFRAGNHVYGLDENEGKVILMDFAMVGFGRAACDLLEVLLLHQSVFLTIDDLMELMKIYHSELVKNGVFEYTWEEFKEDMIIGTLELILKNLIDFSDRPPEKLLELIKVFGDKFENMKEWLDHGLFCFYITYLVSLYLHDKNSFLIADKFLSNL